ncbi:MAG: beta-N-acetylhexosaminidase [candidate division KSB1 bacterium]|nr:beta-N-acetylhexosaminidase [candidate division KSB1 bacterium]
MTRSITINLFILISFNLPGFSSSIPISQLPNYPITHLPNRPLTQSLKLIPQPREIQIEMSNFQFDSSLTISIGDPIHQFAAEQLQAEIREQFNLKIPIDRKPARKSILLGIPSSDKIIKQALQKAGLKCNARLGPEGYVLAISPSQIIIAANTQTGVFYGVQTLKQIIRDHDQNAIPCMKIRDYPMLNIRGVLDDISRGPLPTMDYFKSCIRRFAELKINTLTYYTEHVIRTQSHPEFAPPEALTLEEIQELSYYARKYHIDLVGCFQSFGHFEKILEHPRYEPLGEMNSLLSPAMPESYKLLSDIYRELAQAYPSKEFLVLCDEVWALGKGASESMVKELGFATVYSNHINWIRDELARHNKRIWVAADVALEHREILSQLKQDIVLLPWNYSGRSSFEDMILPIKGSGFDFIVTTGVSCSRKLFPDFATTKVNIKDFVRDGIRHGALGVLNTNWDDFGGNFFSNNWYGIAYGANQGWNSENAATENFDARFAAAFYGDRSGKISEAILKLSSLVEFPAVQNLENTLFWQRLIPEDGIRAQLSLEQWDEIEQRTRAAINLLDEAQVNRYQEDVDYIRYACQQVIFMADLRANLLVAADHYRRACLSQPHWQEAETHLINAIEIIADLKQRWDALADQYQVLWGRENRAYGLDVYWRKFRRITNDLSDVLERLGQAKAYLAKGFYLPSPLQVRLEIRELKEKFFLTWLICGSFPNPKKDNDLPSHAPNNCIGFETDYLQEIGGEKGAHPQLGDRVKRPDGSEVEWKLYTSTLGAEVDLLGLFDQDSRVVAYAFCTIKSPDDQQVLAALGSNDGIKVFLNGEQIFERHELRFVKIDEDRVALPLKKGLNRLLLKIDQGRGKWGFCFRVVDRNFVSEGHCYHLK